MSEACMGPCHASLMELLYKNSLKEFHLKVYDKTNVYTIEILSKQN